MKIAVLGTGMVGQAHAGKLSNLGHEVVVGTHDPKEALARKHPKEDSMTRPFGGWIKDYPRVRVDTFAKAAERSELIIEALSGNGVLEVLGSIKDQLKDKVLVDISNPLDFSKGRPPTLFVCNDDSLAERIQAALPDATVVKAFNTTNANIQVSPEEVAGGDHHLFICGNDEKAKSEVTKLAKSYGWQKILDLGDIKSARGMEMILPIWLEVMSAVGSPKFNFKIAK